MALITILCARCGQAFSRRRTEYNRAQKLERKSYCSTSCATRDAIKNIPEVKRCKDTAHLSPGNRRDNYSPFRAFMRQANLRNRENGREVTITLHDLKEQWESQGGLCPYTGWQLILPDTTLAYDSLVGEPRKASLDRVDSKMGYVPGNIQFVSTMANYAKSNFSVEQMEAFCRAVADRWQVPA